MTRCREDDSIVCINPIPLSCHSAPGTYDPQLPEHLPAFSFGLKTALEKPFDTPAPNAYNPDKPVHAPEYSFGLKTQLEKPNDTPGR